MAEKNASQSPFGTAVYWIGGLFAGLLIAGAGFYLLPRSGESPAPVAPAVTQAPDGSAPANAAPGAQTATADAIEPEAEAKAEPKVEPKAEAASVAPAPDEAASNAETTRQAPETPGFDTVRAEADGSVIVAGRAAPRTDVAVLVDGVASVTVTADDNGNFVALFDLPQSAQPRVLTLLAMSEAGTSTASEESVIITPVAAPVEVADASASDASDRKADETSITESATTETPAADTAAAETTGTAESSTSIASAKTAETNSKSSASIAATVVPATLAETWEAAGPTLQALPEPSAPQPVADTPATLGPPEAPGILIVDSSGVHRPAAATPLHSVVIDTIGYDLEGQVRVSGRGSGKGFIRLYLNNADVATAPINADGSWAVSLTAVAAGLYTMRVDELDASGSVTSRFEIPFLREEPDKVVASLAIEQGPNAAKTPQATARPAKAGETPGSTLGNALAQAQSEHAQSEQAGSTEAPVAKTAARTTADPAPVPELPSATAAAAAPETTPNIALPAEPSPVALPVPSATRATIITVQPGFTLWGIARENYGNGFLYVKVYEANKGQIRDPDLIYPGQIFTVPQ